VTVLELLAQDETTVLWDFQDPTGAVNPGGVITKLAAGLDLGMAGTNLGTFTPAQRPGGTVLTISDPPVEFTLDMMASATTYDLLVQGLGQLAQWLRDPPGPLRWTQGTVARYIDLLGAPRLPALLTGQARASLVPGRKSSLGPIPLTLVRQPWLRQAELNPASNVWVSNQSMLHDSNRDGTPDGFTLAAGTATIQSSVEAFQLSHNAAVSLLTRDFTVSAGTLVTLSVEARKVSGDRTVEVRLISLAGASVLGTATVTATSFGTRYSVSGTVAGGDTSVRMEIRYTGGSNTTVSQFRNAQLETGTLVASDYRTGSEVISNDPAASLGGRRMIVENIGDLWAPGKLTLAAESGSPRIGQVLVGVRSGTDIPGRRNLTDFVNETNFAQCDTSGNGWTRTLGTDTTSVADGSGSGGNVAECTFATTGTVMRRVVLLTRTTLLDSLRGYHDVWVRLKPSAAAKYVVQLRWAPSLASPASYSEAEVTLDWSDATSFSYVDVPLGTIYLTEDTSQTLAGATLEVWARQESGSGNCRFDEVSLFGTDPDYGDSLSLISVPGGSRESWLGKDLAAPTSPGGLSAGSVVNNRMRLNAANEGACTPPAAGIIWGTGRHKVTFRIDGNGRFTFSAGVRNVTDGTDAVIRNYSARKPANVGEIVLKFDGVAAKAYAPYIYIWAAGGLDAGEYLDVKRIIHEVQPYLGSTEQLKTDPATGVIKKLDGSGNLLSYVGAAGGVPVWLPPGRSVLEVVPIDIEVQSGATHGESVLARTLAASVRYGPRYAL
jgi:hypothetical protein